MLAEDWRRARSVLLKALALPSADRIRLIESEFPNEPALLESLVTILENHETGTLHRAAWAAVGASTTRTALSTDLYRAPAEDPLLLTPGKSYGPYLIVRHLGTGGMGQVFLAEDVRLGRRDAVKSLAGTWLSSPTARQRLMREARSAAALTHPNIATVYDVFEDGHHLLLVMEYVEGRSLRDLLSAGAVPPNFALRLAIQIADAIGYAHDRGIVHCDLKPANVQLTPDGTVKVLDFGVARAAFAPDDEVAASERGKIVGTPGYMAPERILRGTVSPSSDVYSLGVIVFELLTGRHPFDDTGRADIFSVLTVSTPRVTSIAPDVPTALDDIVQRALDKDPGRRYQSAYAMARDLRAVLEAVVQPESMRSTRPQRIAATGVVTVLALTMCGFATSMFYNSPIGRTDGFEQESPLGWPLWGIRSLVAPFGYFALFALAYQVTSMAGHLALAASPLRRFLEPLVRGWERCRTVGRRRRFETFASVLLLSQLFTGMILFWRFGNIFAGLDSFVTQRAASQLEILSPSHLAERNDFSFLLFAYVALFGCGWLRLMRWWRSHPERGGSRIIAAGLGITAVSLFFGQVLPYRVFIKSRAEQVTYQSRICYLVGQRGEEAMLFCPLDSPSWRHIVKLNDPALQRGGPHESIFTEFDRRRPK